ncbi:MAG: hypothetical protein AAFO07_15110 [Bacteroidota bacterium]
MMQVIILIVLLVFSNLLSAQITSSEDVWVSKGIEFPLTEPHFVINPNDTNHFLVAAIVAREPKVLNSNYPASHIAIFQSYDLGKNWEVTHFDKNVDLGADPWLAINKKGTIILSALTKFKDKKSVYLVTYTSIDKGKSWEHPQNFGFGHDRQTMVIHPQTQEFLIISSKYIKDEQDRRRNGLMTIQLSNKGFFMRSSTYLHGNVDIQMNEPVITTNGQLFIPYIGYMVNEKMLKYKDNWLLPSMNFGKTFLEPRLMYQCESGSTNIAIDTTATFRNRIFSIKHKGKRRAFKGFELLYSDNAGENWSVPKSFGNQTKNSGYMRNVNMVINNEGVLGIFWYDRRNDHNKNDIYFTYSMDGGRTFANEIRITVQSTLPTTQENGWTGIRWPVGGDYSGIQALPNGSFQIVWADSRKGYYQLFTKNLKIKNQ